MGDFFSAEKLYGNGFILTSANFDASIEGLSSTLNIQIQIFPKPYKGQKDLLVEDVEDIMEAAYLTGDERLFILRSDNYSSVVQNRLLKLLEEPPVWVKFCILANSKSAILPTIRSRLPSFSENNKRDLPKIGIELKKITPQSMFEELKRVEKLDREDAKNYLFAMLDEYIKYRMFEEPTRNTAVLELFERSFRLLSLNTSPKIVFATILSELARR